jgi:Yip1 domain
MADTSIAAIATNIFAAPQAAFAAIRERPAPWLPMIVLMIAAAGAAGLYLSSVDLPWFIDQQLTASGRDIPAEARDQLIENAARPQARVVLLVFSTVGGALQMLAMVALFALYLLGVSLRTREPIGYKPWFALVAWCLIPSLLGALATVVNLLSSDARFMAPETIDPLSFGSLLGIETKGMNAVQRILVSRDVFFIWSIVLVVLGYAQWTKRSLVVSALLVLAPLVVIFGLGSLF